MLGVARDADDKTIKKALCVSALPYYVCFLAHILLSLSVARLRSLHTRIKAVAKPRWPL